MAPRIDIIIVNWHSGALVDACLRSIAGGTARSFGLGRIFIYDNSAVEVAYRPATPPGLDVVLIASPANVGFARACNMAAAQSTADMLLFLNPDTELLPGTLDACVAFLATPPAARCGVLGVQLLDKDGRLQRTCSRFPTAFTLIGQSLGLGALSSGRVAGPFMSDWDHRDTRAVDQVMGAFMLMRRDVFAEVGGFDEDFFLYFEDVDLCRRIADAGYRTIYFADAGAVHIGQGTTHRNLSRRFYLFARARLQYARKHFGQPAAGALLLATLLAEPPLRIMRALLQGAPGHAASVIEGWKMLLRSFFASSVARTGAGSRTIVSGQERR